MPESAAELNRDWAAAVESEFHARRRRLPGIKPALRRTRGRVAIVTDSACCLPSDRSGGLSVLPVVGAHIRVVPIPVMLTTHVTRPKCMPRPQTSWNGTWHWR